MSEVVKLRTRAEIEEEAAAWVWRLDCDAPTEQDREAFDAWLRQDPRHRRAIEELTKTWKTLSQLSHTTPSSQVTRRNPAELALAELMQTRALQRRRIAWGAAAATVLLSSGVLVRLYGANESMTLATAVGQHRIVNLSDGTVVTLNTNTIVETNFNRHMRDIRLLKGEAHFGVAPDRSRPFMVHAGDAIVRAIGTAFEVRVRTDQHVDVLVTQGKVEVQADSADDTDSKAATATSSQAAPAAIPARAVSAGQQLSTATNYKVIPITAEQLSSELAWRDGAVVFDNAPLSDAIAEIQRYTDARIVISDPAIGVLPVGGRFKTSDLDGFLDGLQTALPVTIRRTSDGLVYIDPRR